MSKKSFRMVGLVLYCCATLTHALLCAVLYCTVWCGYCTVSTRVVNVTTNYTAGGTVMQLVGGVLNI